MVTEEIPERAHALPSVAHASVADAMHPGVITCPPETPLRVVARMMAANRVHSVVVLGDPRAFQDDQPWRVVSDLDLVRAGAAGLKGKTAADAARHPVVTVAPEAPLADAAALMDVHDAAHVLVVDAAGGRPVGVLSTLDVAAALAYGRD